LRLPLAGYPLLLATATTATLEGAYDELLAGETEVARSAALELLAVDGELAPARVLAAQADLVDGHPAFALERLAGLREELPGYTAARLLLARAYERLGLVVEAYEAYRGVLEEPALGRASSLEPAAVQGITQRIEEALDRGHLEMARESLEQLEAWAPATLETLVMEARVAAAWEDGEWELEVARKLARVAPEDPVVLRHWADLEVALGDPGQGLKILRRLAGEVPEDEELQEALAHAKFRWRLTQVPAEVQELASHPELSRGDFAVLLYWLVPSIRYGRPGAARIAADILDDPRRSAIARVVSLGVMDVDETLHTFSPERAVHRVEAWSALLRLLTWADPGPACVGSLAPRPSWSAVCGTAVACGLVPQEEECLPLAPVSGREALEALRRALDLLEAR
jgi:tetratricopeptide (TPR) repeat protein